MSSKDESIEVKIESENKEENSEQNKISYVSPEFFMDIIPKTLTKEKFDQYYTQLYVQKLTSIKNLLEIEPKCTSELQNVLIFFAKVRKKFYVGAGKILISIKPEDTSENINYFSLRAWCQSTIDKPIQEWPNHIFTLAHSAYLHMINTQKDQSITLLGKMGTGKTFNALKIIQYLFFISSKQEIIREQYDIINKGIKLMQIIGNIYQKENVENNSCGFVYHIGFKNNDICIFDLDSEILDITLPFSETGRSFTLLHGFLLTQEKCFNLKHSDFNFFKKYNTIFKENNKEEFDYHEKRDIENFKIFTELCQIFLKENEYVDVLNLFYIILLCNQVTILKNFRYINGVKKEIYFIGEDGITHRIANVLGVNVSEFMSIFFDDMDYSLEKHKNILVSFMKYSYYCIHDFILNKIKQKLKAIFSFNNTNVNNSKENNTNINNNKKLTYIHIIDLPGEKRDQTLGGMTLNYANECLYLYSISNYTSMLSILEKNNIRLKKFQAPYSYDIMKSLVNNNGLLTFLNSDPHKKGIKFEELLTKSDNIPSIIQYIEKKQLINLHYTCLSSCYFFQDLFKESKTLIINKNMIKLFKNCGNVVLSQTTLVTKHNHFVISEYINNKLKYLFCGIEDIEPFIVNCVSYEDVVKSSSNYNYNKNIFNEKRNIIMNTLNWIWYGYEEWITLDDFLDEFWLDFVDIKNHYLYHKDINRNKINQNLNSNSKRDLDNNNNMNNTNKNTNINNISKTNNNTVNNTINKKVNSISDKGNKKEKAEEIISVFNFNNEVKIGSFFLIMKKGTFNLLKLIEKTLLININTSEKEVNIDIEQIKQLPIPKNLMNQLIKEHKERKEAFMKRKEIKKQKEIEKIPYSYINEKNMEELFIPGNKIINFQILSPTIFKNLKNKNVNFYHINNLLNKKKLEEQNKNNIIIPKSQNDYQNLKLFFDQNNELNSNLYDKEPILEFIINIQRIYRGYIIRKKFTHIYKYVKYYLIILQKNIRGFLLRTKYSRFMDCLKKIAFIQYFYKKYFKKKLKAIRLIQKNFRIYFKNKIAKINENYQKGISNFFINGFSDEKNKSNVNSNSSYQQKKKFLMALNNIKKQNYGKEIFNKQKNKIKNYGNQYNNKINNNNVGKKKKEEIKDITNQFIQETNRVKIINTLLYNKNFMIDADEKFNTDYYRTVYKTKFVYPNLRKNRKKNRDLGLAQMNLEDRLIQYGEDKKLKHLMNNFKYHEEECKKCSFKPQINDYEFEDSFYERNLKFMEAKRLKLEYNKIKEEEIFKYECTFKPKINNNNIKRTVDDLFLWQEKINKEKEEMKQLYEEFTEKQIQNLKNFKPKNNYYSNMKYLEKMAEKMKNEENKINQQKSSESKSSHLTTNGYIDIGFEYDVWPLHLKKDFH